MSILSHETMMRIHRQARAPCSAQDVRRALKVIERVAAQIDIDIHTPDDRGYVQHWSVFIDAIKDASPPLTTREKAGALARRAMALIQHPLVAGGGSDDIPSPLFHATAVASMPLGQFRDGRLESVLANLPTKT